MLVSACAVGDPKPTTYVSDTGAVLNGDVYSSLVGETRYWFKYGTTTAYGSATAERTVDVDDTIVGAVWVPRSGERLSELAREGEVDFRQLAVSPSASGRGGGEALTRHGTASPVQRGAAAVVVDCETSFVRLGLAEELARQLEAPAVRLAHLQAGELTSPVKTAA